MGLGFRVMGILATENSIKQKKYRDYRDNIGV